MKKRVVKIIVGILIIVAILVAYMLYHDIFYLEDHCKQVALQEVGGYKGWGSKQVASPPWFGHGEKIFIGFYKELQCEHNNKAFYFF